MMTKKLALFAYLYDHADVHNPPLDELEEYFEKMADNVLYLMDDIGIVAYVEFWRISFAQFGLIMAKEAFDSTIQPVKDGPICFIHNVAVRPDKIGGSTIRMLKRKLMARNSSATHFAGHALHNRNQPIKVFRNGGIHHGR